jgi:hypothetical protein
MILVKLKVNTKPKERIAQVTQERANQLIKAYPDVYSLVEEKSKEVKPKEKDETK